MNFAMVGSRSPKIEPEAHRVSMKQYLISKATKVITSGAKGDSKLQLTSFRKTLPK